MADKMLFGKSKVQLTIDRVKMFGKNCVVADGFGKDSTVMVHLFRLAGVDFEAHFHRTSVDPPELLEYGRRVRPDTIVDPAPISMYRLIVKKGTPPTRIIRYCCHELKETHVYPGRTLAIGVRRQESVRRKNRKVVEHCLGRGNQVLFHPIVDWTTKDVWEFIRSEGLEYCCLYDEGYKRLGCVGCPMASRAHKEMEMERWPQYQKMYMMAFGKMLENHPERRPSGAIRRWKTAEDVYDWWMRDRKKDMQPGGLESLWTRYDD